MDENENSTEQTKLMERKRGKLIVFEGTDSSGKVTQAGHLFIRLRNDGEQVEMLSFPTYQKTKYGRLVAEYLAGMYGDKESVPSEISSMFYAIDRYQLKKEILEKLKMGIYFIFDRYTQSNIFQAAKQGLEKGEKMWEWIKALESRLPQPDAIIFLNVAPEVSENLFKERQVKNKLLDQGEMDINEKDRKYQQTARELYLKIAANEGWIVIECCRKEGDEWKFRTPQDIHEEIYSRLKEKGIV
ncbi:MAG: hypothetical protein ISS95_01195 [Candidatus Aenigmarchaeota archaeon]|nr:hypothetical protein [Candidatus Aenigmarchaeota archaeon]